jgi:hypothetical protein
MLGVVLEFCGELGVWGDQWAGDEFYRSWGFDGDI